MLVRVLKAAGKKTLARLNIIVRVDYINNFIAIERVADAQKWKWYTFAKVGLDRKATGIKKYCTL